MSVATRSPRAAETAEGVTPRNEVVMLFDSTLPLRFWRKVYAVPSGCWEWQAWRDPRGYGRFWLRRRLEAAYRLSYEDFEGPIPDGLEIDHLCRNPSCVRPGHLEAVSGRVNKLRGGAPSAINARKTHCDKGHPFDLENTRIRIRGRGVRRVCRACNRDEARARKRAQACGG